jgi:hypothetical protein
LLSSFDVILSEVFDFEELTDLDVERAWHRVRAPFDPFDGLVDSLFQSNIQPQRARRFEARLSSDPALQVKVNLWQGNL